MSNKQLQFFALYPMRCSRASISNLCSFLSCPFTILDIMSTVHIPLTNFFLLIPKKVLLLSINFIICSIPNSISLSSSYLKQYAISYRTIILHIAIIYNIFYTYIIEIINICSQHFSRFVLDSIKALNCLIYKAFHKNFLCTFLCTIREFYS